ncbi:MAG: hypothetical protein QOD49_1361 [Actinomycetota bacterium]|nr:hypothetical protein [Actinomycetota bacterium]
MEGHEAASTLPLRWLNAWQPRPRLASIRPSCGDGLGGLAWAPPRRSHSQFVSSLSFGKRLSIGRKRME